MDLGPRHLDRQVRDAERSARATRMILLVGVTGFEPATFCSQSRCATKLRYTPAQAAV